MEGITMFCPECGEKIEENHKFCGSCGAQITENENQLAADENYNGDFDDYGNHNSLNKKSHGWSWFAFLFGPLWYLYKGMIKKGIIILIVGTVMASIIPGIGAVAVWIYCGFKGNEDFDEYLAAQ